MRPSPKLDSNGGVCIETQTPRNGTDKVLLHKAYVRLQRLEDDDDDSSDSDNNHDDDEQQHHDHHHHANKNLKKKVLRRGDGHDTEKCIMIISSTTAQINTTPRRPNTGRLYEDSERNASASSRNSRQTSSSTTCITHVVAIYHCRRSRPQKHHYRWCGSCDSEGS